MNPLNVPLKDLNRPDSLGASRRAQSMSVLPRTVKLQEPDEFSDFEQECAEFEAHRAGLLAALEVEPPQQDRYAALPARPLPSRTQPFHPRSRRVKSAPCLVLSQLPPSLLDDLDEWEDDFTITDFVVPEIKAKAEKQVKESNVETWDTDFEDDLEIPGYIDRIQTKFKTDMQTMRNFALHIQGF